MMDAEKIADFVDTLRNISNETSYAGQASYPTRGALEAMKSLDRCGYTHWEAQAGEAKPDPRIAAADEMAAVLTECKTQCAEGLESYADEALAKYNAAKEGVK